MTIIRVIDFETSGTDPKEGAEVCEVGMCDYHVETKKVMPWKSWLCRVKTMPPEVRAVHHIKLSDCEPFAEYNPIMLRRISEDYDDWNETISAYAAHNMSFEEQFFAPGDPTRKVCTYKVALRHWPDAPRHTNGALRYWLEDQGLIQLDDALTHPTHRAGPDAYVTANILKAMFETGLAGFEMVNWTREHAVLPRCPIGKFRDKPWPEVEYGFLDWMLHKAPDMSDELKFNARRELERRRDAIRAANDARNATPTDKSVE